MQNLHHAAQCTTDVGEAGVAETTSVAGEHRVSECGEQEMEQQDGHRLVR